MIISEGDVQYSAIYKEWQRQGGGNVKQITWSGKIYRIVKDSNKISFSPVAEDNPFGLYGQTSVRGVTTSRNKP